MNKGYEHPLIERPVDKFMDEHPKVAAAVFGGVWAGFAVVSGIHARRAMREGNRKEAVRGIVGVVAGGAVAGALATGGENPFRFE